MNNLAFWIFGIWIPLIIAVVIWSLFWKGMALWKAARQKDKGWFIALLLINTLGILDILYIYIFGEKEKEEEKKV